MSERKTFSVITVVWKAVHEIEKTLQSVLHQSSNDYEYIVIDGGSTDGTLDVINENADKIDIIVSEPDKGIYNAMNKGLRLAQGRYVIFMNAGDTFASHEVLSQVKASLGLRTPQLVYGEYVRDFGNGEARQVPSRGVETYWYGMFASHQSMLYSLDFLRAEHLQYDESYKIAADYKLTCEVVKRVGRDGSLQLPFAISRFVLGGVSTTNQNLGLAEADRVRKEVMEMSSFRCLFIHAMLRGARIVRENKIFESIYSKLRY